MDPTKLRRDIINRSVTLQVAQDYNDLRLELSNARHGAGYKEHLSNKATTDPMMDPLYRMLVEQARENLLSKQKKYKIDLGILMSIRSRVERFLKLLARNSAIRKRIEDARSEFAITSNLLSELRLTIQTVDDKQKLITEATSELEAAKTDIKASLQKQRDEYQALLSDYADAANALNKLKVQEQAAQEEMRKVVDELTRSEDIQTKSQLELDALQAELNALITQLTNKTKERDQLKLNASVLSDELDSVRDEINDRRSSISKNKNMNDMMNDQIKKQLDEVNKTKSALDAQASQVTDVEQLIKVLTIERDVKIKELADLDLEDSKLAADLANLNTRLQQLTKTLADSGTSGSRAANKLADAMKEKRAAETLCDDLAQQLQGKRDSIQALKMKAVDIQAKITAVNQKISDLDAQSISTQDQADNVARQRRVLEQEIEALNSDLEISKQLESDLLAEGGVSQSTLDKLIKDQNERQKALIDLTNQLTNANAELDKAKETADNLKLLKQITDAMKERDRLKTNQDQLQSDIDKVSAQLATLKLTPQQILDASNDPSVLADQLADLKKQIQALEDKNKELQRVKDILANPNADAIIKLKGDLDKLEQKGNSMALTPQEQMRKQSLETLLGGPVTQEGIDKYKTQLEGIIADNKKRSLDIAGLQTALNQLDALIKLKDQAEVSDSELDALKQKLKDLGVSDSDMDADNLASTIQKYKELIDKTQSNIDNTTAAKTKLQLQLPLLQQLKSDVEDLKKADADKSKLTSDYKDIVKRISDIHQLYNLGGLPDPEDVEAVGEYTKRLIDLEQRHKVLSLQSKLQDLESAKAELDALKSTNSEAFKLAMDEVLGGSAKDLTSTIQDINNRLASQGLAPDTDPQAVVNQLNKINNERSQVASKLKRDVDVISSNATKQKDVLEQIYKLMSELQTKVQMVGDAISTGKMQVAPAIKLVIQRLDDTIAELIKLSPTSGQYIQQLAALKLQLKQIEQDIDPSQLVARITKVANELKQSGDNIAAQNKVIADLVTVLEQGAQESGNVTNNLSNLMDLINSRQHTIDVDLAEQTASLLYDTIGSIKNAKVQEEALALLLSDISFSFITDKSGTPVQLSYRSTKDSVVNDYTKMAEVVTLIGEQIDTLTKPGNHKYLASKLKSGVRDPAFIQEVDTLVLTVWVYDMIHTFQKTYNRNMEVAEAKLKEISSQIDLSDANQVLKINKNITETRDKFAKGMKDVSTLLFSQILLPGRQSGTRTASYEQSIQHIQSKLGELQGNTRVYVPMNTLPLMPANKSDAGRNNLSLIFNAMSEAYAATSIFSKPNMQQAGNAFNKFLETMKQMTSPLANYNLSSYTSIQNLDQLIKLIVQKTLVPSNDLIANLDQIRKMTRSQGPSQGSRVAANLPQSNLQTAAPVGYFTNRNNYKFTRSFRAAPINQYIQNVLDFARV